MSKPMSLWAIARATIGDIRADRQVIREMRTCAQTGDSAGLRELKDFRPDLAQRMGTRK